MPSPASPPDGLSADRLAAIRGERLVLRDVTFHVKRGGAMQIVGANGAGKSTLLRVLAGLARADAGTIAWCGAELAGRVAYVGHLDGIKLGLTTAENLGLAARLGQGSVGAALETLGLGQLADLPARMLSAGQRRRLALSRLALNPAPVWLLDEPTIGLDTASIDQLGVLLAAHRTAGGVVLAATHLALPLPDAAELRL